MLPPEISQRQDMFFAALEPVLADDARIRAAWLEGSYGRDAADRYSDVDLHILIEPSAASGFRDGAEGWLSSIRPLVLFSWLFDRQMINALTSDGLRIDIWLLEEEIAVRDADKVHLLHARPGSFRFSESPAKSDPTDKSAALASQIREFWRCIALLPSVLGRDELIVSQMGLAIEIRLLADILVDGYKIERDAGVKKLNAFLPEGVRTAIEEALSFEGLSHRSMAVSHLRLAAILQQYAPLIAFDHHFDYPMDLESAVIGYVASELDRLDLGDCLAEAGIAA